MTVTDHDWPPPGQPAQAGSDERADQADLTDLVRDQLAEHPYQVLAVAAGVGFALAGGWRLIGRAALGAAGRLVVGHLLAPATTPHGLDEGD